MPKSGEWFDPFGSEKGLGRIFHNIVITLIVNFTLTIARGLVFFFCGFCGDFSNKGEVPWKTSGN
jgi:hypothetical protein